MGADVPAEPARRRSSLFTSPAMRRSLGGGAAAGSASKGSPAGRRSHAAPGAAAEPFDIPQYDDEAERRQQQQAAAELSERRRSIPDVSGLSHGQLAAHYASCIKLSAENKISTKNAFSLQLIDCMAQMMRQKKSDLDNFQVASATLDASAKIYGCRVEVLHGDTLRMAGGLGRAEAKRTKEGGEEGAEGDDQAAEPGDRRRRKARRQATVERNLGRITGRPAAGEGGALDPLLRRATGAAGDDRAASVLILGCLPVRDDRQQLRIDGEEPAAPPPAPEEQERPEFAPPDLGERLWCPPLQGFSFTSWSVDDERESERAAMPPPPAPPADLRHRFDMNAPHSPIPEEPMEDMFDGADDDCDPGDLADGAGGGDSLVTVGGAGCRPAERPSIVSMVSHVSHVPQEYSYFVPDMRRMLAWAGPKHWKLRLPGLVRPAAPSEGPRQRRKKEPDTLDYESELDWKAAFVQSKKPIQLKPATMKKWSDEKTTLPEDLHYDIHSLYKLSLWPDARVAREPPPGADSQGSRVDLDGSVAEYDYDNDRDTNDYCPDLPRSDDCEDYNAEETFVPSGGGPGVWDATDIFSTTAAASSGNLIGDNLVQAPKKVEKILISYARTAKKMDMRKLKAAMWEILAEKGIDDKENTGGSPAGRKEAPEPRMPAGREFSFRELYHRLPGRLSAKMADNLSVALAFTALLHTANERCLRLAGAKRLDDFFIAQDSP